MRVLLCCLGALAHQLFEPPAPAHVVGRAAALRPAASGAEGLMVLRPRVPMKSSAWTTAGSSSRAFLYGCAAGAAAGAFLLPATRRARPALMRNASPDEAEGEGTDSQTDWDGAWAEELSKRKAGTTSWRPEGREPVREVDVMAARGKQILDDGVQQVKDFDLKRSSTDPKFLLGVLLVVSVLLAVASSQGGGQPQTYSI